MGLIASFVDPFAPQHTPIKVEQAWKLHNFYLVKIDFCLVLRITGLGRAPILAACTGIQPPLLALHHTRTPLRYLPHSTMNPFKLFLLLEWQLFFIQNKKIISHFVQQATTN